MIRVFAAVRPDARASRHLAVALAAAGVFPELVDDADGGGFGEGYGAGARGGVPVLRPVAPENWHITLAFYGDIPQGAVPDLTAALRAQMGDLAPGEARLAGAGVFGGRTLWVGARDEPRGLLRSLAQRSAEAGEDAGVGMADEERPRYRAHLTVARLSSRWVAQERNRQRSRRDYERRQRKQRGGDSLRGLGEAEFVHSPLSPGVLDAPSRALSVYEGPTFPVEEVELIASRLGEGPGGGPAYELLETIALPGGGFDW